MCRNSAEKTKAADEIVKTKLIQCYVSQEFFQAKKSISKTKREKQNLAAETEVHFKFLMIVSPVEDLVLDSGATSKTIEDREMFF